MAEQAPPLLRPRPRRPFDLSATPSELSRPSSPPTEPNTSSNLDTNDAHSAPPSRTRSILNLTSSTLFGIYSPTGYASDRDGEEIQTPWGTGAETPIEQPADHGRGKSTPLDLTTAFDKSRARRSSVVQTSTSARSQLQQKQSARRRKRGFRSYYLPLLRKTALLAAMGVGYGVLISNLHDRGPVAPVKVQGIPHHSAAYLIFWALSAVVLGGLLPFVDGVWEKGYHDDDAVEGVDTVDGSAYANGNMRRARSGSGTGRETTRGWLAPGWSDVVRSIGLCVGLAFAIRRLPWQSTLQLSLALALSNPAIWYLLDRTPPGFILSTTVAVTGTALLLSVNPDLVPSPGHHMAPSSSAPSTAFGAPGVGTANATLFNIPLGGLVGQGGLVAGLVSQESVGVATWIASVLFVSCVCFGNVGRRL